MADKQIPNLPSAIALSGDELLEIVQAGTSCKSSIRQISSFVTSGVGGYLVSYGVLQSDYTLGNSASFQRAFNWSTNGALTLAAGTYEFECGLYVTGMSTTSGNLYFGLQGAGGTAIPGKTLWVSNGVDVDPAVGNPQAGGSNASDAVNMSSPVVPATTSAALRVAIKGMFEVTTEGTIIPSVALENAIGTAVMKAGSYFRCTRLGAAASPQGDWS